MSNVDVEKGVRSCHVSMKVRQAWATKARAMM